MEIIHCLLFIRNKKVSSLLYTQGSFNLLKIKGKTSVPVNEWHRDEWAEYAGICSDDKTDICLVYDETTIPYETFAATQCESKYSIWNITRIQEAVEKMEITTPTEFKNENGLLLFKSGCFLNASKDKIASMTVWYTHSEMNSSVQKNQQGKTTAFIEYYKSELQAYKKGY